MRISERSFRVHSVFGKLRIGILLVSSSSLPKGERDHRGRTLKQSVGSEGFYDFCDALTAGGADSQLGLIKM
jgi:hypothetical protein